MEPDLRAVHIDCNSAALLRALQKQTPCMQIGDIL